MIEAVIFDMDGVLVETESLHFATTNAVLARHGAGIERRFYDSCLGMAEEHFFELLVERLALRAPPARLARERIPASLERLATEPLPPNEGVLECLLQLRADGRRLAVASSATGDQVRLVLGRLGVAAVFDAVVSIEDVSRGKPAPDLFLEAARRLGTSARRCLVVEDAVLGVEAARAAGMSAVALLPPSVRDDRAYRDAGAVACLRSLSQLIPEQLDDWSPDEAP